MESIEKQERGIIARLEDIGEIKAKITEMINLDIFDQLSKHHPQWNIEFKNLTEEKYHDSMDEFRRFFRQIEELIYDIQNILYRD